MSLYHSNVRREKIVELIEGRKSFLFLGAAGVGMSALAQYLTSLGAKVTGIDKDPYSDNAKRLRDLGIPLIREGEGYTHSEDAVVYSLAIDAGSKYLKDAVNDGIPIFSRAQLLSAVMSMHELGISVSGTHGKSTTVAMLGHILTLLGKNPTVVSGAGLGLGEGSTPLRIGGKELFIAEGCEYKNSLLYLKPKIQVVTDIEFDHPDFFNSVDDVKQSFGAAIAQAEIAVVYGDSKNVKDVVKRIKCPVVTYGSSRTSDFRYSRIEGRKDGTSFTLCKEKFYLPTVGIHNVKNAAAATATAAQLGVSLRESRDALESFYGIERRLEKLCEIGGTAIYYDYAHHPSEISSAIDSLKEIYGSCAVIFKPHTYSRTKAMFYEFASSLRRADKAAILDIYAARERPIDGVDARSLAHAIKDGCEYLECERCREWISRVGCNSLVIMGAGDVNSLLYELGIRTKAD